jgi:hypothetical protein
MYKEPWYELCRKCKDEIKELIKKTTLNKLEYKIDDSHVFVYEKYGPVIKKINEETKEKSYMPVKKDIHIDLEKLKEGGYDLEDLLESRIRSLGNYENEEMFLKNGKHGFYVEWGSNKKSIKNIEKSLETLDLKDVVEFLENEKTENKNENILRELTKTLSVRKSKYGAYVYYKKPNMIKPEFLNIKKFKGSFLYCEKQTLLTWLNENYKINETLDE